MVYWKTINLNNFDTVPLRELVPGKKYIMYGNGQVGNGQVYPGSRWIIIFKERHDNNIHIVVDVLNVAFSNQLFTQHNKYYLGENKLLDSSPFIFYDYNEIFKMKTIMEKRPPSSPIKSLASLSKYQLPTSMLPIAKRFDQLGGKRTKKRSTKAKRKTRRRNIII